MKNLISLTCSNLKINDVYLQVKKEIPQEKKEDQKTVDAALIKAIESVPELKTYLGARFSLSQGMKPHELVF